MRVNDSRGSIWRKWDLHVHTIESFENSFNPPDWSIYIEKLKEKAIIHNISVVGINDYFTIDGYKYIYENFAQKDENYNIPYLENEKEKIYIFPVVELRTNNFIKGKALNIHVLFDNQLDIRIIENDFLEKLKFEHEGKNYELKKDNLIRIGKNLTKTEDERSILRTMYMKITISKESLREAINDFVNINGNRLIVFLVGKSKDGLSPSLFEGNGKLSGEFKNFLELYKDICIFTNKKEDIEKFVKYYKKPCLWGSDAHKYESLFIPNGDKKLYTWIKADPTFDGLKQIIYEPEERVKIQENNPSDDYPKINCIDSISIESSKISEDLEFKSKILPLNHDLITIIGGRGSGKTALLDIIASCFKNSFDEKIRENENSFYKRAFEDNQENTEKTLKIKLKVKGEDTEFEKTLGLDEEKFKDDFRIEYIPQNYLDKMVGDYEKLTNKIRKLLFDKLPYKKEEESSIEQELSDIQKKLKDLNTDIISLREEIKEKTNLIQDKNNKDGELKRILAEIEKYKSIEDNSTIDKITSDMKKIEESISKLNEIKDILEKELEIYSFHEIIQSFKDINEKLNSLPIDKESLAFFPIEELESMKENLSEIYQKNLKMVSEKIEQGERKLKELNSNLKKYKEKNEVLSELHEKKSRIEAEIRRLQKEIESIEEKERLLRRKEEIKKETLKNFLIKVNELKSFYLSLVEEFMRKTEGDELLKNISFKPFLYINEELYKENIFENLHRRKIRSYNDKIEENVDIVVKSVKGLENLSDNNEQSLDTITDKFVKAIFSLEDILLKEELRKPTTSLEELLNSIDIIEIKVQIELYLKDKSIKKLSMGERAVAMLKLYLAYDDVPLLIDQPEEGLDNSYISTELVETFRKAKKRRQIIIATHNANLVVNTDAEQIIVAEHRDGVISYTSGALENPEIKEKIITILEGGKQAFENRERKLGIKD